MIGSRAWRALMRRNLVYRKRNWLRSLFEIILPVAFVGILVAIKNSVQDTSSFQKQTIDAYFPQANETWTPLSFQDYLTAIQAGRYCHEEDSKGRFNITGIVMRGFNWQVPFVKCDSRKCTREGEDAQPFCEYGIVAVAPSSSSDVGGATRASDFKQWLHDSFPVLTNPKKLPFDFDMIRLFDSPGQIDEYVQNENYGSNAKVIMAIVWYGNDTQNYEYALRPNATNFNAPEMEARQGVFTTPNTAQLFASYARNDQEACAVEPGSPTLGILQNSCTGQYLYNGVLTFQRLIGDYILTRTGAKEKGYSVAEAGVQFVRFPIPQYETNGFYAAIALYAPLLIILGLLYPFAAMISYIVREKELRLKELMKMMGVTESDIGWSWFCTFLVFAIITSLATAGVSTVLYENSTFLLLWIFWIFSLLAFVVFAMAISTVTSKTTRAVLFGLLIFFIGVFLTLAVDYQTGSRSAILLISLHPVAAFSYGLQEIGRLEDLGIGLQASTTNWTDNPSGYTFSNTLTSLIFDSIIWGVVSWYLNRVIKPDYGQALPLWFPFTLSYWCPAAAHAPKDDNSNDEDPNEGIPFEAVSNALKRQKEEGKSIEIHGLRKVFGDKVAVDGLSLSMYNGQITALLGHNGAGKTTTINCLTGAMTPSKGYATILGKDTRTQIQQIREDIGICPQHNCLFPMLTVREHVQFFSRVKGLYAKMSREDAEAHIDQAIQDVALSEKRNTLSKNLSGGMKRKLSVAIAFCGGSSVVLLDEPTSGMDPFARRFTWNVIRQYRNDRCIILTTHFMDEADLLGDRIAIMAEGQLRCAGSSLFLKKTFGVGYQLTIEKLDKNDVDPLSNGDEVPTESKGDTVDGRHRSDDKLKQIVTDAVEEATLLTNVASEMSFQLPMGAASKFAPMFTQLDREIEEGAISSYGVSITTLDEVFLLVARGETTEKQEFASSYASTERAPSGIAIGDRQKSARSRMDLDDEGLFVRHLEALFKKRAANFRRDKKAWVCTTIVPSLFVLIGLIIFKFASPTRNLEPVTLSLDNYNPDVKSAPRNPIPFNSPDNPYTCQPGICAYQQPVFNTSDELYTFCGYQARFFVNRNCSITDSESIVRRITAAEAAAEPAEVETIYESSLSLSSTSDMYDASQYGAIFYTHDMESKLDNTNQTYNDTAVTQCLVLSEYTSNYTRSVDCNNFTGVGYVIQYNYTALHVAPLFQVLADEALAREALDEDDFNIKCTIDPMPITKYEANLGQADDAFSVWFLVVLSFPFIGGAFSTFVVSERQSKAKHLQTVAGVQPASYWISTYMWDCLNYQIPCWITVALLFAFGIDILTTTSRGVIGGVIVLLLLFGPATAGFSYCVSFAFKSASFCNVVVIISGFLIGMGGPLATFILILIGNDPGDPQQNLVDAANIVTWILRFFPTFCLGNGLFRIINIEVFEYLEGRTLSVWSEQILLYEVIFLAWESIVYLMLAIQIDKWSTNPRAISYWRAFTRFLTCRCCVGSSKQKGEDITVALPDDDDVIAEQNRVLNGNANDDLIVLSELTKVYDTGKVAVNNVSFGVPPGECFGLLGINGAGKTTIMAMLTAEFPPTSGDATLAGYSVRNEPEKIRRRIGYCPQFDALFANLTGREHVELYAAIKGVPREFLEEAAAAKLAEVGLSESDSDRLSSGYSGGMKRRLSLACAMIGQPQIVFLDEASTGVDPVARREIWQLISDMVTGGVGQPQEERTSVILTTHSMEECEALCPRITIMANGRLCCIGSAQHLKNKFGQGYQVEMKIKLVDEQDEDYVANVVALARTKDPAVDEEAATTRGEDIFFNLEDVTMALQSLTGDDYLSKMISADDLAGYTVWKDATSAVGATLDEVAAFATIELRMRKLQTFMNESYPNHELRERQDTKNRYEVSSEGVRLSSIFAHIEANKEELMLSDYGISQTSLENIFNMHAAEAEALKQGRMDN